MVIVTGTLVAKAAHALADKAVDGGVDFLKDKFKEKVIERWSEHRARKFFQAFVDEVRKEKDVRTESADLNDMLLKISEGEREASLLFESYRRVALSASKDIGPMVIGLLTASIVAETIELNGREATNEEEQVFMAAESLNDRDFTDFLEWADGVRGGEQYGADFNRCIPDKRAFRVHIPRGGPTGAYSLKLPSEVGPFALKLSNVGLLLVDRREPPPSYGGGGAPDYALIVEPACVRLYEIAMRAKSANGTI